MACDVRFEPTLVRVNVVCEDDGFETLNCRVQLPFNSMVPHREPMKLLDKALAPEKVSGQRYADWIMATIDR